jgi:hypothetical protein
MQMRYALKILGVPVKIYLFSAAKVFSVWEENLKVNQDCIEFDL